MLVRQSDATRFRAGWLLKNVQNGSDFRLLSSQPVRMKNKELTRKQLVWNHRPISGSAVGRRSGRSRSSCPRVQGVRDDPYPNRGDNLGEHEAFKICCKKPRSSPWSASYMVRCIALFEVSCSACPQPVKGRVMSKRILVADNNAMIRKSLCRIFEIEQDYDICAEAVNGEEAITLAIQHKPDLIILDFQMPVMNGIEAARELKRIMPDVPIILFTLHSEAMMYNLGQHSLFDLIVPKSDAINIVKHVRSLIPV
jgi:CheY-like chemotaxis protein